MILRCFCRCRSDVFHSVQLRIMSWSLARCQLSKKPQTNSPGSDVVKLFPSHANAHTLPMTEPLPVSCKEKSILVRLPYRTPKERKRNLPVELHWAETPFTRAGCHAASQPLSFLCFKHLRSVRSSSCGAGFQCSRQKCQAGKYKLGLIWITLAHNALNLAGSKWKDWGRGGK